MALWVSTFEKSARGWKPDLLVPILDTTTLFMVAPLVRRTIAVQGSVKYTSLVHGGDVQVALDNEIRRLRSHGLYSSWHHMAAQDPVHAIRLTMNVMGGTFFASNLLLLTDRIEQPDLQALRDHGQDTSIGMAVLLAGPKGPPHHGNTIHIWLSDRSPDWEISLRVANTDLPVLLGILLAQPDGGRIRLHTAVRNPDQAANAEAFLATLIDQGRMPVSTTAHVSTQSFLEAMASAGGADLHILGLPERIDVGRLREIRDAAAGPCLFLQDSGQESLLA
jgi:hypothetical protein